MSNELKQLEAAFKSLCQDARNDVNLYCELISGETQQPFHRQWQAHAAQHQLSLIEAPRGHGKSMQMLRRNLWATCRDLAVNNRFTNLKIVCSTKIEARKRGLYLQSLIESPVNQLVFPELKYNPKNWSAGSFSFEGNSDVNVDATFECEGIDSIKAGGRADRILVDDPCTLENSMSKVKREKIINQFDTIVMKMLKRDNPDTSVDYIFTPYHTDDLSARLKKTIGFELLSTPIKIINGKIIPLWADMFPAEFLELEQKQSSLSFARGRLCLPITDSDMVIKPQWIKTYIHHKTPTKYFIGVDLAFSQKDTSDYTAFVVLSKQSSLSPELNVVEAVRGRFTMQESIDRLTELARRYNPMQINIEAIGGQVWFVQEMRNKITNIIKEIKPTKDKRSRLFDKQGYFENGHIKFLGDGDNINESQRDLYDEVIGFGIEPHDDLLDALLYAIEASDTYRSSPSLNTNHSELVSAIGAITRGAY